MKTLAKGYISLSDKAKEFGFLDVQERLKRTLIKLAEEHGIKTGSGTLIGLNITHEEMGDLIAANRTTITAIINEFGRRGYIRRDGRYFVMVSPEDIPLLDNLTRHVVEGDDDGVARMIKLALDRHVDPISAFNALANGMRQVDQAFVRNEMGISDIILAAHAMKTGISAVEGAISNRGFEPMRRNKVVIGTVFGDIHDIGRTVVSMLLVSHNFRVVDLGANVSVEQFIKATEENLPCILAMSCLMTRSAVEQRRVIKSLKDKRLSKNVAVMVGGNAISKQYVAEIGANGYAASAQGAVELARRLTKSIKQ
jgi:methanogenic corrinoid protein MtbC1